MVFGGVRLECRFPVARRGEADSPITWPEGERPKLPQPTNALIAAELVGRLRTVAQTVAYAPSDRLREALRDAADRIESLEAENERLAYVNADHKREFFRLLDSAGEDAGRLREIRAAAAEAIADGRSSSYFRALMKIRATAKGEK